jgi:di/tripeptidase
LRPHSFIALEGHGLQEVIVDAIGSIRARLALHVEIVGKRPAGRLARDSKLLGVVRGVRAELGLPDVLGSGSTDANAALAQGIPALTLGVATGSGMHSTNERIDLDSLAVGLRQVEMVVERVLTQP